LRNILAPSNVKTKVNPIVIGYAIETLVLESIANHIKKLSPYRRTPNKIGPISRTLVMELLNVNPSRLALKINTPAADIAA
jgi:hypothetical protein